ncbi:MAG: PTS sugar transporter subunit IIA [Thermodesulfobacteriota bacterium]
MTDPSQTGPGFIIVTHGEIGSALLAVARYILGRELAHFTAVSVPFMGGLAEVIPPGSPAPFAQRQQLIAERIQAARAVVDTGGGVVVLTDVLGGTSFTTARGLLGPEQGVVAGVNLPMVLKAAELQGLTPAEAAAQLVERSRRAIVASPGQGQA